MTKIVASLSQPQGQGGGRRNDILHALQEGARGMALLHMVGTVVFCLLAGAVGIVSVRLLLGR